MRARSPALLLAALPWLVPLEARASDLGVSAAYAEAVRQYARGERAEAQVALARLRPEQIEAQVRALQDAARRVVACISCPDPAHELPLRAAILLHADVDETERAARAEQQAGLVCPAEHARRAGRIAAVLFGRDPKDDFPRRFFLAMAQRSQRYFCLDDAEQWGRDGLKLFPRDAQLLESVAAALEEEAFLWAPERPVLVASHRKEMEARAEAEKERAGRYAEAARLLEEAVAADPSRAEARVRLGRVQWRLGRLDAARAALEEMLRRGGPAPEPYLAHLCLGQIHAAAGRTAEALEQFTQALTKDPQSQAAAVALSEVLLRTGDGPRARRVLEQALIHAGRRKAADAHWRSVASHTARMEELFEKLRSESRQ